MSTLPTDYLERKMLPVFTFLTKYFPLSFLEVVRVAVAGDKQHGNTGQEIHWAREKSTDQLNTALRHMMDYGTGQKRDTDGRAHLAKAIWRLSAQLQLDEEADIEKAKPERVVGRGGPCYYCAYPDREPAPACCPVPNNHLPAPAYVFSDAPLTPTGIENLEIAAGSLVPCGECKRVGDHAVNCSHNFQRTVDRAAQDAGLARYQMHPPRICSDCGVDLDSRVDHAATCLRMNR